MLPDGPLGTISFANINYMDTFVDPTAFSGADTWNTQVDTIYGTLLMQPLESFTESWDHWDNPRIPLISSLKVSAADGAWSSVDDDNITDYYSLLGMPIGKPAENLTATEYSTTFTMQSAFLNFSCSPFGNVSDSMLNATLNQTTRSPSKSFNLGLVPATDRTATNLAILLVSQFTKPGMNASAYETTTCNLYPNYVESNITCDNSECSITAVRQLDDAPARPAINYGIDLRNLLPHLTSNDPQTPNGDYSQTQLYLANGPANRSSNAVVNPQPLQDLDLSTFTARFALLLNTYWQAGIAPSSQTGSLDLFDPSLTLANVTATIADEDTVFKPFWPWLAVLFFCSVVLLVAGLGCAIWDARTLGPDVFGFASTSLLKNSRYVKLPDGSSGEEGAALSGPERARLLADLEVMIQDVRPDSEVGKIALGTKVRGAGERSLKRGRLYR